MYQIKIIKNISELNLGNIASIDIYNWGGEYRPKTFAILCFVENQGFCAKLWCEESDPRATYTEPNSPVCRDSCIEFFGNFFPEKNCGYINFEANANGALLCEFGRTGGEREYLLDKNIPHPEITPFKTANEWGYTLFVPLSIIKAVYGTDDLKEGSVINASFFKCGDDTAQPHYGSFNEIPMEHPTFHQPQFFKQMEIAK